MQQHGIQCRTQKETHLNFCLEFLTGQVLSIFLAATPTGGAKFTTPSGRPDSLHELESQTRPKF